MAGRLQKEGRKKNIYIYIYTHISICIYRYIHIADSRMLGEISITSDIQMIQHYGRKQRRTKEPLDESERGE